MTPIGIETASGLVLPDWAQVTEKRRGHIQRVTALLDTWSEAMHVSARNVTGLVDHLERDGLVVRVPDPEDRRSVRARLTEEGQRKIERVWKEVSQHSLVLVEDLPQEDLDLVRHTCLQLIQRMESRLRHDEAAAAKLRSTD